MAGCLRVARPIQTAHAYIPHSSAAASSTGLRQSHREGPAAADFGAGDIDKADDASLVRHSPSPVSA
ncbi:hypothetical protein QJQ45_021633, partial [Haematococcus lacustris]